MKAQKFFMDAFNRVPDNIERQVNLSMSVSDRIAFILKERGMTQKDFARKMGRTEAEVSRWLGGTHNFTFSTIAKISSFFNEDIIQISAK